MWKRVIFYGALLAAGRRWNISRPSTPNPLLRMPMTFTEIFPVGVLVSLISAGLLCKPSFLPARR